MVEVRGVVQADQGKQRETEEHWSRGTWIERKWNRTHPQGKGSGKAQRVEGKVPVTLKMQAFLPRLGDRQYQKITLWASSQECREARDPGAAASGLVPSRYPFLF